MLPSGSSPAPVRAGAPAVVLCAPSLRAVQEGVVRPVGAPRTAGGILAPAHQTQRPPPATHSSHSHHARCCVPQHASHRLVHTHTYTYTHTTHARKYKGCACLAGWPVPSGRAPSLFCPAERRRRLRAHAGQL